MPGRYWIVSGALVAGLAVTAGAMGTHLLKEKFELPAEQLETFEVAVRYQMYHALALVAVGLIASLGSSRWLTAAGVAFGLGILLFSGGIYAYLATGIKPFVHVVPIGGMSLIVAWVLLATAACGCKSSSGTNAAGAR